jgi:hypothetical protein
MPAAFQGARAMKIDKQPANTTTARAKKSAALDRGNLSFSPV